MAKAQHAMLSASGASRWLACTPSAKLESEFPESTSAYAEEGTVAHKLAEITARYFLGTLTEAQFENEKAEIEKSEFYSAEMDECAVAYAKLVAEHVKDACSVCVDAQTALEVHVDFSDWVPAGFGTGDCIIVEDSLIEIIDFKYGKGVRVEAEGNAQMRLYALGAVAKYRELFDLEKVNMTIFQPRLSSEPVTAQMFVTDLLAWGHDYVKPRAKLAAKGKGNFAPSEETCRFCRAKAQCRARAERNMSLFDEAPETYTITPNEAGMFLRKATDIRAWLEDLESIISGSLMKGETVSGWKMVEGRSNRRFADELKVAEAMKAAGYEEVLLYKPKELITLTQMEKDFGKKAVGEVLGALIIKPAGKPTLAPESDRRPAYTPEAQILAAFDEV